MVKMFFDCETTGTNPKRHSVHQLAGHIEVDNEIVETFDFRIAPHEKAHIDPLALKVCKVTATEIMAYPQMNSVLNNNIIPMLDKYCDRFNPQDKIKLVGFNNRAFDDQFFRCLFELCGNTFFGAYFWSDSLDVQVLASEYLADRRPLMPSFKLKRVAQELGIVINPCGLHDALFDATLTRQIYRIVTNLDLEI